MRALVVYCHPDPDSFTAHLRNTVTAALWPQEVRVLDLYAAGFEPVMHREERLNYHTPGLNEAPVADHVAHLKWCDTLIFVYPTWWFGQPAMLKGWLDRVLIPHVAFALPTAQTPVQPLLHNITTLVAVTTCGARRWQSKLIGEPGRKTLLRGIRCICHPRCRTRYAALYRIDTSTRAEREAYAARVHKMVARL